MGITVCVILHRQKVLKGGFHPVMLRFTQNRKHRYLTLNTKLLPKEWDDSRRRVIAKHPHSARLNAVISESLSKAESLLAKAGQDADVSNIIAEFKGEKPKATEKSPVVYAYFEKVIKRLRDQGKNRTARGYEQCLSHLKKFKKVRRFEDLTLTYVIDFGVYLSRTHSVGGASVRHRALRSVINKAIDENLFNGVNPYSRYKIKQQETPKRAISLEDLKKIKSLQFDVESPNGNVRTAERSLEQARNVFLFLFHCSGMNLADASLLTWDDVKDSHINYRRSKTGKLLSVPITNQLRELIEWFRANPRIENSRYVLPVMSDDCKNQDLYYQQMNKRINQRLRVVAEKCGIEAKVTTYTARHSWATLAKHNSVPVEMISEILGHKDVRVTSVYLASFADEAKKETLDRLSDLL